MAVTFISESNGRAVRARVSGRLARLITGYEVAYVRAFYPAFWAAFNSLVVTELRRRIPVRTGRAARSIRFVSKGATGKVFATAGSGAFYTPFIVFKTPQTVGGRRAYTVQHLLQVLTEHYYPRMVEAGNEAGIAAARGVTP